MEKEQLIKEAAKSIIDADKAKAKELAKSAIAAGMDPLEVIDEGFSVGIAKVGDLFGRGELFLPELILSAEAMKVATDILSASLPQGAKKRGKVVIGTAQGDIHDIGKSMVVSFLQANGFEVYDIGRDVETQKFIDKAQEVDADIIGMSALLTTTMSGQKTLIEELKKAGLRDRFKVMVGGAPATQRWADRIGADAYGVDAADAAEKAMKLLGGK
ncbi:MAG: B12-binding domain-containing protein [Dehalococcoidia bacterium]|jgi:trimethylamine corrinoid protein|nr:B12-binding domain-containing protein [Dehalococcoidia bacterium]